MNTLNQQVPITCSSVTLSGDLARHLKLYTRRRCLIENYAFKEETYQSKLFLVAERLRKTDSVVDDDIEPTSRPVEGRNSGAIFGFWEPHHSSDGPTSIGFIVANSLVFFFDQPLQLDFTFYMNLDFHWSLQAHL